MKPTYPEFRQKNGGKRMGSLFSCPHSVACFQLVFIATNLLAAQKYDNPTPWSYQRIFHHPVQVTKDDLDRFILARLEKENLGPIGDAPRAILIRRASFDG